MADAASRELLTALMANPTFLALMGRSERVPQMPVPSRQSENVQDWRMGPPMPFEQGGDILQGWPQFDVTGARRIPQSISAASPPLTASANPGRATALMALQDTAQPGRFDPMARAQSDLMPEGLGPWQPLENARPGFRLARWNSMKRE